MGKPLLLLLGIGSLVMLSGCGDGHQEDLRAVQKDMRVAYLEAVEQTKDRAVQRSLIIRNPLYIDAARRRDSLFNGGPFIRYFDGDSLARADSITFAVLVMSRLSCQFYTQQDTVGALYTYLEYLPWLSPLDKPRLVEEFRFYAETTGDAISATHSPNMARLSYQAFERAKRLALAHGDPMYIHLADSSYRAVARQVLTMPDSVRLACGPAPERPARIPWVLATLAAAFIAASVAGGWGWNGNT